MRTLARTLTTARSLRRQMTPPEALLWSYLRVRSEGGPRFRRQHPIGPYIADFYCPCARLVIEIEGWGHNMGDQPQKDERRDAWLAEQGYAVARFPASEVMSDADSVADALVRLAMSSSPLRR